MLGGGQAIAPIEGKRGGAWEGKIAFTLLRNIKCFFVQKREPLLSKVSILSPKLSETVGVVFLPCTVNSTFLISCKARQRGALALEPSCSSANTPASSLTLVGTFSALTRRAEEEASGSINSLSLYSFHKQSVQEGKDNLPLPFRTSNWQHSHITSLDLSTVNLHK